MYVRQYIVHTLASLSYDRNPSVCCHPSETAHQPTAPTVTTHPFRITGTCNYPHNMHATRFLVCVLAALAVVTNATIRSQVEKSTNACQQMLLCVLQSDFPFARTDALRSAESNSHTQSHTQSHTHSHAHAHATTRTRTRPVNTSHMHTNRAR